MKWIWPEEQKDLKIIDWLLKSRNIQDQAKFLNPSFDHLHDPFLIYDLEKAAKIILEHIASRKKIFIHGDYDVDGITATSIMWNFLYRDLKADVFPFIPSRFDDGYGLSETSVENIIEQGGDLIITVDCGVKDLEIVKKYHNKINFIITDHHTLLSANEFDEGATSSLRLQDIIQVNDYVISKHALAVVHPKLSGKYPFTEISGAVVSWKLCQGINLLSGDKIDMSKYLDLAALGTVCDVMPLVDENRAIVRIGLEKMRENNNVGVKALLESAAVNPQKTDSYHLGYVLGPRLNAPGRLESALESVRLLSTYSEVNASKIAQNLNKINLQRQELTQKYFEEAEKQIKEIGGQKIYLIVGDDWPEGIIGLIAGKLAQKYHRPVLVASRSGDQIKGSARSLNIINIADTFKNLSDHLVRHGGHSGAAGFTLNSSALPDFQKALSDIAQEIDDEALIKNLKIDAKGNLEYIDLDYLAELDSFGPYGFGHERPIIGFQGLKFNNMSIFGKENNHIKFNISDGNKWLNVISFGKAYEIRDKLQNSSTPLNLAGYLEANEWNGNTELRINLIDIEGN